MPITRFIMAVAAIIATTFGAHAAKPIKLGVAAPFTGSGALYGEMISRAAELAVSELNAKGGIKGRTVEIIKGDDEGKNDKAATVAKQMVANKEICFVVGHFNSTCSLAGKPIYKQAGVVQFSPGSTNVAVCEGSDYTFRNLYRDDYQGTFLANYTKKTLGLNKVAVFFDNDDYGKGLKDAFMKQAKKVGLEVATEQSYVREKTSDFAPLIDIAKSKGVEAIFIAGLYAEAGAIVKQAHAKGLQIPFMGGDGVFGPGFMEIAGKAADGTLITTPFMFGPNSSEAAKDFAKRFKAKYGKDPDCWAALTYDAVSMALKGIAAVGADREALRDWMEEHDSFDSGYKGITGVTYFDENGDCLKPATVAIVKDGKFAVAPKQMQ